MNIDGKKLWVIGGDGTRQYQDVCLDWDVILIGPGHLGSFELRRAEYRDSLTAAMYGKTERFCD